MTSRIAIIAALALLTDACHDQPAKGDKSAVAKPTLKAIEGYAGLKFGMSFNEAIATAAPYQFNGAAVKDCLVQLAIRGCLLSQGEDLAPYRTIDGIPYGLKLAFNRQDKLTDISLTYIRDSNMDADERISKSDCLSINNRTVDWITRDFGPLGPLGKSGNKPNTRTANGNGYYLKDDGKGFFVFAERALANARAITLFNHYLVIGGDTMCNIDVTFKGPDSVERWSMSPEDKADFDRVTKSASSDASSEAVEPDGSGDADEASSAESEGQWGD